MVVNIKIGQPLSIILYIKKFYTAFGNSELWSFVFCPCIPIPDRTFFSIDSSGSCIATSCSNLIGEEKSIGVFILFACDVMYFFLIQYFQHLSCL